MQFGASISPKLPSPSQLVTADSQHHRVTRQQTVHVPLPWHHASPVHLNAGQAEDHVPTQPTIFGRTSA